MIDKIISKIPTCKFTQTVFIDRTLRLSLLFFLVVMGSVGVKAQEQADSVVDENFVIASVIVADPGDKLYSAGGHVGLRMECPDHHLDYVFTYESEDVSNKIFLFWLES